jgi:DNA-binding response OmpR family regulator
MKISDQYSLDSSASRTPEPPLIYVVDDLPCLAELYTLVLEDSGYEVRAFTDRAAALAALKCDDRKPEILITDYVNDSMPVERFIRDCREAHPDLWILMVSGFGQVGGPILALRPDRFLQKPFAPEELRRRVQAGLEEVNSETFRARKKSCSAR